MYGHEKVSTFAYKQTLMILLGRPAMTSELVPLPLYALHSLLGLGLRLYLACVTVHHTHQMPHSSIYTNLRKI